MRAPLVAFLLISLVACVSSDSGTGPSGAAINGSYSLATVDNKPLPVAFADSSIESGTLTVTDSGWTQATVVRYKLGGSPGGDNLALGGFWSLTGSNVTLYDFSNSTAYTGTYTSTGITLTTKTSTVLSYSKQ